MVRGRGLAVRAARTALSAAFLRPRRQVEAPARGSPPLPARFPDDQRRRAEPRAPYCIRARDKPAGPFTDRLAVIGTGRRAPQAVPSESVPWSQASALTTFRLYFPATGFANKEYTDGSRRKAVIALGRSELAAPRSPLPAWVINSAGVATVVSAMSPLHRIAAHRSRRP